MGRIEVSRASGVLEVVLSSPRKRNALSLVMLADLTSALTEPADDVSAVVLRGDGETFSAGADFSNLTGSIDDVGFDDEVARATEAIRSHPRLVVAAIEGPCLGAAVDLALSCDARVAGEGSFLQIPATRLGILYNPVAVARMHRSLPGDTLRRLLLLGERFDHDQAYQAGLMTHVAPRGGARSLTGDLLGEFPEEGREAVAATKGLLNALDVGGHDPTTWEARRRELLASPQRRAAVDAAKSTSTSTHDRGRR